VSYTPLINPGQKGDRRGIIGDFIQKGPDRFFYNTPDSLLPQVGDHVAPAIYGKWIVDQTNRSLNPNTPALNPLAGTERVPDPPVIKLVSVIVLVIGVLDPVWLNKP
jgi:hypothetical protein